MSRVRFYITSAVLWRPWRDQRTIVPPSVNSIENLEEFHQLWSVPASPHIKQYIENFDKLNISREEAIRDRAAHEEQDQFSQKVDLHATSTNDSDYDSNGEDSTSELDATNEDDSELDFSNTENISSRLAAWDYNPNVLDRSLSDRALQALEKLMLNEVPPAHNADPFLPFDTGNFLLSEQYMTYYTSWKSQITDSIMVLPPDGINGRNGAPSSDDISNFDQKMLRQPTVLSSTAAILPNGHCAEDNIPLQLPTLTGNRTVDHYIFRFSLKGNQIAAFAIPALHFLSQDRQHQLLHYIGGGGGTGKSRVIQAIIAFMRENSHFRNLLVAAPTGRAAVSIGGKTLHSTFKVQRQRRGGRDPVKKTQEMRTSSYLHIDTILIDEISMSSTKFWDDDLLPAIRLLNNANPSSTAEMGYGLNYVFVGDFYQHDPISTSGKALHRKLPETEVGHSMHTLWKNLSTAVILTENHRTPDPVYAPILSDMRERKLTFPQLQILYQKVISDSFTVDLLSAKWRSAVFITTLNDVRIPVNSRRAKIDARYYQKPLFVVPAVDTIDGNLITHTHKVHSIQRNNATSKIDRLERVLHIFEGAPIVVTTNINPDIGLCNGASAVVKRIFPLNDTCRRLGNVIILTKPPLLEIRLNNPPPGKMPSFPGINPDCLPLIPRKDSCQEKYLPAFAHRKQSFSFIREQLPVTLGYAITDYKAQGGSWDRAILDLRKTRAFTPATLYVMCSRVRSLDGLAIIGMPGRSPAESLKLFNQPVHTDLIEDTSRLPKLSAQTIRDFRDNHHIL